MEGKRGAGIWPRKMEQLEAWLSNSQDRREIRILSGNIWARLALIGECGVFPGIGTWSSHFAMSS